MIKILFVTNTFETIGNGPGMFANLVYSKTKNSQLVDLRVLTEDTNDKNNDNVINLKLRRTRYNKFLYQILRIFKYYFATEKIKKNFDYDILVFNNAFTGVISAVFSRCPVVVMINDYERLALTGTPKFTRSYLKNRLLFFLEKAAAQYSDKVIVNSKFMQSMVSKYYNIPSSKSEILLKGIDLNKYKFRLRKHISDPVSILFVKADYRRGGLVNLIGAIKQIHDKKFKLIVIGPPQHELNNVSRLLESSGIDFELHGAKRPHEVRQYFFDSDIYCVPAIREALGVANMEALACGLPIVSTNVGGIPEVLDHGKGGWMTEPDNTIMLKQAIEDCISNDQKRMNQSLHGREHVQKFNSNFLIDTFTSIIKRTLFEKSLT